MRLLKKSEKGLLSLALVAALLISMLACTLVVNAETTELAETGEENYYLWGLNTNDPDFGAMSAPTGSFSYDGTKGYYYYDLQSAGGDYCFVVSKVNNNGASAVKSPAVGGVQNAGNYYLSQGNYHGYACMHLWNPSGDAVRIYFTSENAGLNCIAQSEAGSITNPTTSPVTPTTGPVTPTSAPVTNGYVYCRNSASWGEVYAYMWNDDSDKNAAWPGVKMTDIGGGVWRYAYTKSYANIIFNIGSDATQTADLSFPGNGCIFDNASGSWSSYSGNTSPTTSPVTPTTSPVTPTTVTPTTSPVNPGSLIVYCENEAGWSTVTAYMWNSGTDSNGGWPGVKMTSVGNNIWQYNIPKSYQNIIFSENGQNQTTDLSFPGSGYMYNNKTGQWKIYDTSPLQVQSFGTDLEAPQFAGTAITLSANATGEGTVYYKFSVGGNVLKDFSTANSVVWTPATAGTYTVNFEFRDANGNTNKRDLTYKVTDGSSSEAPFIKRVTPSNNQQVKRSSACNINISAGGGNVGTKLLFYKVTVKDATDKIINTPYYTRNTTYSFTPTALGKYTVTVSVQGSDNTTITRDYVYNSVNDVTTPTEDTPGVIPTQPATQPATGSSAGGKLIGDADMDGTVTILDATRVQRFIADLVTVNDIDKVNADADYDGSVTVLDATRIQRFVAGLVAKL